MWHRLITIVFNWAVSCVVLLLKTIQNLHMRNWKNLLVRILLIYLYIMYVPILYGEEISQTESNPIVISVGDATVTRQKFEERFQLAMVMMAAQSRMPIKNQIQIQNLRFSFLERYATDLALYKVAIKQGISVTEQSLDELVSQYLALFGITEYSLDDLKQLGFKSEQQLRMALREKNVVSQLVEQLHKESGLIEGDNQETVSLSDQIQQIRQQMRTSIYPERINGSSTN